jgi:hypothetical protein
MTVVIVTLALAVSGCTGSGETAVAGNEAQGEHSQTEEADHEHESASDVSAPPVTGSTVTDLEEIEGTWIAAAYPGNFVLTIFPDNTLSVATSLEDLKAGSTDTWNLTMEDGEITATDFALCLGDVGSYVATLQDDGTLRFTSIIDPCDARLRKMDRSLPGRLNEYILIYHPVD